MGGMLRCIRNEYNLDQIEYEINRTDSEVDFDGMLEDIKQRNNIYIDDEKVKEEGDHYSANFLVKDKQRHNQTVYISSKMKI